jgi:hypothetical protein
MNELFVQALEASMGVKRTEVSLSEMWSNTGPEDLREIPLAEYLALVGFLDSIASHLLKLTPK